MDLPLLLGVDDEGVVVNGVADRAARAWLAGGLVGLPTETVYGLSADAQDPMAVARIYEAKGRPADHPLIVHVQGPQALAGWSAGPNSAAERLVARFWPGALTVVVARSDRAGDFITGGQDTVALRCPDHPVARACLEALARLSGDPSRGVAAPSANRFGRVSPTRALDVLAEVGPAMDPARDLVLDGGPCAIGVESTIVDCTATPPRVLRLGAISQEQIDAVLAGDVCGGMSGGVADGASRRATPARAGDAATASASDAPGTLESHYAPLARGCVLGRVRAHVRAPVDLVESAVDDALAGLGAVAASIGRSIGLASLEGPEPARITGAGPDRSPRSASWRVRCAHARGLDEAGGTGHRPTSTPATCTPPCGGPMRCGWPSVVAVLPDPRRGAVGAGRPRPVVPGRSRELTGDRDRTGTALPISHRSSAARWRAPAPPSGLSAARMSAPRAGSQTVGVGIWTGHAEGAGHDGRGQPLQVSQLPETRRRDQGVLDDG